MPQAAANASQSRRSRFLDLPALASLAHMRFATRHQIEGSYTGRHRSKQKGGAGEFVDYREYVEGEDLRRLDWKVLGRTGRAYVRLFQDETNLLCTMMIDASASMLFGSKRRSRGGAAGGSKLEYAQYFSTALSQLILRQQDQVGLAVVADGLADHLPPAGTASHVLRVQEAIEQVKTQPATRMAEAARELFGRVTRRGVLLVLSDFLVDDLEKVFASFRLFRHRHWEVVVLHLIDPDEERLPEGVAFRFEGMENDGMADCSPAQIRELYEERFEAHAMAVRNLSLAAGCDYRRVSTAVPYLQTLSGFLVERNG
jgi:uncharacterized protein (DUF58 family)